MNGTGNQESKNVKLARHRLVEAGPVRHMADAHPRPGPPYALVTAGRLAGALTLALAMLLLAGGVLAATLFDAPTSVSAGVVQDSASIDTGGESSIAVTADGDVYVAWEDDGGNGVNNDLYYTWSGDNGQTWPTSKSSSYNSALDSHDPSLASAGAQVYVAWVEDNVVAQKGLTANPATARIVPTGDDLEEAFAPDLAVESGGGRMHLVFQGVVSGTNKSQVFYSHTDGGWLAATVIYTQPGSFGAGAFGPRLDMDANNNLHVVLQDFDHKQIRYISATNTTHVNWHTPRTVSTSASVLPDFFLPDIAVDSDGVIHVVWTDEESFTDKADYPVYARSRDGVHWTTRRLDDQVYRVGDNAPFYLRVRVAALPAGDSSVPDLVYAAWEGDPGNCVPTCVEKVWLAMSEDGGQTWSSPRLLSQAGDGLAAVRPVVATDPVSQTVHVAWSEQAGSGDYRVYYGRGSVRSDVPTIYLPIVFKNR